MIRRQLIAASLLAACSPWAAAQADRFPSKPIQIINPFPVGGTTEILARLIAPGLQKALGQTVIVETKAGAGGNIGLEYTARAPADGHTIAMYPISSVMAPSIYKNLRYDPLKDLAPVGLVGKMPALLVVHPSRPYKTMSQLIDYARANPGKLSYSSAGIGTSPHLFMEFFKHLTGTSMTHVPYKGAGPALTDSIGGQVDVGFQTATAVLPYVQNKQLHALATSTVEPFGPLPQLPSIAASGVPQFDASAWFAMVAPAGTPQPVLDKLNASIRSVLASPDVAKRLDELGVIAAAGTAAEFEKFRLEEAAKWAKVAQLADIKAE